MAYLPSELDALNNTLLASQQDGKITAAKHRQYNRAVNYELYDPQSRANLLAGIATALNLNEGDTVMIFSNGTAKQIDISNFSTEGSTQRKYLGRFTTILLLKDSYADDDADRTAGDYAQVAETNTYWERDPDLDLAWFDTGDVIDNPELDTYPTDGNFDRPASSGGTKELLDGKSDTNHTHSAAETWLAAILDGLVSNSALRDEVFAYLEQGTGISISINEITGKIRFTNTNPTEGDGANWGVIGGDINNQSDLKALYLQKSKWESSSLIGTNRVFNFNNSDTPWFEIFPTGDETWSFDNYPTDLTKVLQIVIAVNYTGITEYTAGLPALAGGAVHSESGTENTITEIPLPTGKKSAYRIEIQGYRKANGGWNWIFGEGEGGGTGASTFSDLTGAPTDNAALATELTNAKARANHTGTQAISTVTDLQTTLDSKISTELSIAFSIAL